MDRPSIRFPTSPRRWAARLLGMCGWRFDFRPPPGGKALIVVYPHTSNWDFLWGILARWACGWPMVWVAKDSLFRWPIAGVLRAWGGISVNRKSPEGFIDRIVAELETRPWMLLVIAPEGTRSHVPHWKSGFYRIALRTNVPVGVGFIDYATRSVGIREYLSMTGDAAVDLARLRDAYAPMQALCPERAGEIRFAQKR